MDRAILATWYDLPESGRREHLAWLHDAHLPALAMVPGHAWVAHYEITGGSDTFMRHLGGTVDHTDDTTIPGGTQFLLLIGAGSPWLFSHPEAKSRPDQRPAGEQARIGERTGSRTAVFVEEDAFNGPDVDKAPRGGPPGPAIQFGCYSMPNLAAEFGLMEFYSRQRGPTMARYPGCIAMRKLVAVAGHGRHAILYEFVSLESRKDFEEQEYRDHDKSGSVHAKTVNRTIHLPGSPSIGRRTWPPLAAG